MSRLAQLRERFHATAHEMRQDEWAYLGALEAEVVRLQSALDVEQAQNADLVASYRARIDQAERRAPAPDDLRRLLELAEGALEPFRFVEDPLVRSTRAALNRVRSTLPPTGGDA